MTWTSFDRWTCPTCGVTEVADYPDLRTVRVAIRLAQEQHARDHAPEDTSSEHQLAEEAS